MDQINTPLQQNRGNIRCQYFPPVSHFSRFMCFTIAQHLVRLFPLSPMALPSFPLDDNKEKYDFLFIQKNWTERKREKWDPKQYMALVPSGLWCMANIRVHFTSGSVPVLQCQGSILDEAQLSVSVEAMCVITSRSHQWSCGSPWAWLQCWGGTWGWSDVLLSIMNNRGFWHFGEISCNWSGFLFRLRENHLGWWNATWSPASLMSV